MENLKQSRTKKIFYIVIAVVLVSAGICLYQEQKMHHNIIYQEICSELSKNIVYPEITTKDLEEIKKLQTEPVQVDWQEILYKPASEITQQEYTQIAEILIQSGEAEILESMLNLCYEYTGTEEQSVEEGIVTVRSYHSNKKVEELAAAVNRKMLLLQAVDMGQEIEVDGKMRRNAICINQLLQVFLPFSEELNIITTENMFGESQTTSKKLIEVTCDSHRQLQLKFFQYTEKNQGKEKQQPTVISVSNEVTGIFGKYQLYDKVREYGEQIPYMGENMIFADVFNAGALINEFEMTYVSFDIKGALDLHAYSLYPSATSQDWIRAFNEYMQNGNGALHAQACGYTELPDGELTMTYFMTHLSEVCEVWDTLRVKGQIYCVNIDQEIIDMYIEMDK